MSKQPPTTKQSVAVQGLNSELKMWKILETQQRLPTIGLSDFAITRLLYHYASLDSNNQQNHIGIGEREARIACPLVQNRHYGLIHGIGRSGVLDALQPKAEGSSRLYMLTNSLVNHALKISGLTNIKSLVFPVATGMALSLSFSAIKKQKPDSKYVIIPRIDQRTCIKCPISSHLIPKIVPNLFDPITKTIYTNTKLIEKTVNDLGPNSIAAIMSVTSCFAPRIPDDIEFISQLCKSRNIHHIINNAYGVTSRHIMKRISHLIQNPVKYRVDAVIQSTDKNFMVPVGGSIISVPLSKKKLSYPLHGKLFLSSIASMWAGRASISPIIDLFITLLHFGQSGLESLISTRETNYLSFTAQISKIAQKHNFQVVGIPPATENQILKKQNYNPISFALLFPFPLFDANSTEDQLETSPKTLKDPFLNDISSIGSKLFYRQVTGHRLCNPLKNQTICDIPFTSWGCHYDKYPFYYLTMAAAPGLKLTEIQSFCKRLDDVLVKLSKSKYPQTPTVTATATATD